MIIQFDPKNMHIQVLCGILEKYEPSEEIRGIYEKVEILKKEMAQFRDDVLNPKLNEINQLVEDNNKKYTPNKS